ncbi:GNAT family N-acetyltransferase [Natronosporangium hydrolyticum]|uniref:GNAT family N-acetyltransferase n=1 Tax=Natronosporangium hydrolyticum TaxID=2811111 RepID=A0A895YFA2_9ACTN|nr:GNAT family N-acetyltransferase [Natronosporangium hydrolyticum]QSB16544.1 GNAT family N-acetyltransferase [Natronosporangium hydrolyticum]
MQIRTARPADLPVLREIERAAGESFRAIGMAAIADDEPLSVEELGRYQRAGRAWVAAADAAPVAYLIAEPLDGCLHIEQVSVHPEQARQGVGRLLLARATEHARAAGLPALTLTTFAEVPWNGPYYRRCGFREVPVEELTPGLREVRRREAAHGLDRWPRVVMRVTCGEAPRGAT